MPRPKKQVEEAALTDEEQEALELGSLNLAEVNDGGLLDSVSNETPKSNTAEAIPEDEIEPAMTDPGWSEYVMKQFAPDEQDGNGNPNVVGLRRVARLLLGPIIKSEAHVVQAPNYVTKESTKLAPTTVQYTVEFLWVKDLPDNFPAQQVRFTDAADVFFGNTENEFLRFPTSTAATRAEARCLRKALQLSRGVVSAEETTDVPLEEAGTNGLITPSQITFIDILCRRNNINVMNLLNSGKNKYSFIEEIPYGTAEKINEYLSGLQNKSAKKIPDNLMGYDPKWRKEN